MVSGDLAKQYLADLPYEILANIIKCALEGIDLDDGAYEPNQFYPALKALRLVSKKFAYELEVLDTTLFATIRLEPTPSAVSALEDSKSVKRLQSFVKHVVFAWGDYAPVQIRHFLYQIKVRGDGPGRYETASKVTDAQLACLERACSDFQSFDQTQLAKTWAGTLKVWCGVTSLSVFQYHHRTIGPQECPRRGTFHTKQRTRESWLASLSLAQRVSEDCFNTALKATKLAHVKPQTLSLGLFVVSETYSEHRSLCDINLSQVDDLSLSFTTPFSSTDNPPRGVENNLVTRLITTTTYKLLRERASSLKSLHLQAKEVADGHLDWSVPSNFLIHLPRLQHLELGGVLMDSEVLGQWLPRLRELKSLFLDQIRLLGMKEVFDGIRNHPNRMRVKYTDYRRAPQKWIEIDHDTSKPSSRPDDYFDDCNNFFYCRKARGEITSDGEEADDHNDEYGEVQNSDIDSDEADWISERVQSEEFTNEILRRLENYLSGLGEWENLLERYFDDYAGVYEVDDDE